MNCNCNDKRPSTCSGLDRPCIPTPPARPPMDTWAAASPAGMGSARPDCPQNMSGSQYSSIMPGTMSRNMTTQRTQNCTFNGSACFPVGMGYVPMQPWEQPYPPAQGLNRGTLFPSLDLPFMYGRCAR